MLGEGELFGKYRIVRLVAEGGMSEVYEAVHVALKKAVALKLLSADLAALPEARERFLAEAENAARICHPNVVDVIDVGVADGLPYLVMTLLDGEDLASLYARRGCLPIRELTDLLLPVAGAVAVGHAQGVVHRDLKPENIFLHREGRRIVPKVLDFGIAVSVDTRPLAGESDFCGTPRYMSPEQALGDALDARTDQYSFGVIMYEGATGRPPRHFRDPWQLLRSVAHGSFEPPSAHVELPAAFEALILRAMAREPRERFGSMRELAGALAPFASAPVREYWAAELGLEGQSGEDEFTWDEERAGRRARLESESPRRRGPRWAPIALVGLFVGLLVQVFEQTRPSAAPKVAPAVPEAKPEFELDVNTSPAKATLVLDGRKVGLGHYARRLPKDGAEHESRIEAAGFSPRTIPFRDHPPPALIALSPSTAGSRSVPPPAKSSAPARLAEARAAEVPELTTPEQAAPKAAAQSQPHIRLIDDLQPRVRIVD